MTRRLLVVGLALMITVGAIVVAVDLAWGRRHGEQ